jgi:xanthine dehydrogenase accessory factor
MSQIIEKANELIAKGGKFVLVTVVRTEGSVPREVGTKMIVMQDGSILGSIGGGRIEVLAITRAKEVLKEGRPRTVSYSLDEGDSTDTHMACGGEMELLFDPIQSRPNLMIAGGGHIALPLARIGFALGFRIVVIDDREEFANKERFPEAEKIVCQQFDEALNEVSITPSTYLVIVTRGHRYDELVLRRTIKSRAAYIGMIGSRRKVSTIFENLKGSGISEKAIHRVHAPIGLDIGAETPEEIAVSILAEIIKLRRGGTGESLAFSGEKKVSH